MKLSRKRIIILISIIVIALLFRYLNLSSYLSLELLQSYKDLLKHHVNENYVFALCAFALAYILAVTVSLPAAALSMLGGFLFGTLPATFIVTFSATISACIVFLVVRYLFGSRLQEKYKEELKKFNNEIAENGVYYLITLRLSVVVPFFLVNVLAGLTQITLATFIATTFIGIIPATVVFTYAGQQLQTVRSIKDVFTPNMLLAFLLLAALSLIPVFVNHWKKRKRILNETEKEF